MTPDPTLHHQANARLRGDMAAWATYCLPPPQTPAAHHLALIAKLAEVRAGRIDRLMVLMPPGAAKSTYASALFPPWWFAAHPASQVIACSHTASLADNFAGRVRASLAEHGARLGLSLGSKRAAEEFNLASGGSYFAAGVQGAITGRRADLILIDDPVRGHADADSATCRDALWDWYRSDLLTRLKPGGRIVLIMTRWHEDDLGGRLLEREPGWHCLRLPALAEAHDPLGRPLGAPLWPEWESANQLERKRAMLGERDWAALFQQSPRPPGQALFALARIETLSAATPTRCIRAWDLAATAAGAGDPDWTVGVKLGREASGRFVVMDVVRLRGSALEVEQAIARTAAADGMEVPISLPQDPGQAGKSQVRYLASLLAGYRVHASPETGSKITRATPVASQIEAGNFAVLRAEWTAALLDEMRAFPLGRKDDQVDALSRAFAGLIAAGAPARRLEGTLLGR